MVSKEEKKDAREQLNAALTGFVMGVAWIAVVAFVSYQIAMH